MASPPMWKAKPPSSQLIISTTTIRYNKLLMVVQLQPGYIVSIYFIQLVGYYSFIKYTANPQLQDQHY
jgi:hypothetical protein